MSLLKNCYHWESLLKKNKMSVLEFIKTYLDDKNTISSLTIELTNACNLRCCHCYVANRKKAIENVYLDSQILKRIIAEARLLNVLSITFTGGEPLLHPDFFEIIKFTKRFGFIVFVKTNGTLINKKNIELIKNNVDLVELSKYAFSPKTYLDVTGKPLYNAYVQTIELLEANHIRFQERGIIIKENEHEIDNYIENQMKIEHYISTNAKDTYSLNHLPSKEVLKKIYRSLFTQGATLPNYKKGERVCNLGTCSLLINSKGDYNPCTNFYYSLGNVKDLSLEEVWKSKMKKDLIEKCNFSFFTKCRSCENVKYIFSMAPCNNYAETNDMNSVSKNMCYHCSIVKEVIHENN